MLPAPDMERLVLLLNVEPTGADIEVLGETVWLSLVLCSIEVPASPDSLNSASVPVGCVLESEVDFVPPLGIVLVRAASFPADGEAALSSDTLVDDCDSPSSVPVLIADEARHVLDCDIPLKPLSEPDNGPVGVNRYVSVPADGTMEALFPLRGDISVPV